MSAYRLSLIQLVQSLQKNAVVVEVGVHRGRTTEALLRACPEITVFMVDPWAEWRDRYMGTITQEQQDEWMAEALRRTDFAHTRRVVCRTTSEDMASRSGKPDLVFIDAEHHYEACKRDIELWYPKIEPGVILCGHDYNENHEGVIKAVDEFSHENGIQFQVEEGSVWWLKKPDS